MPSPMRGRIEEEEDVAAETETMVDENCEQQRASDRFPPNPRLNHVQDLMLILSGVWGF